MHSRMKYNCIDCGGKGICEHGKQTSHCSQGCGGSSWCAHGRIKRQCNLCGGSSVCEHGKRKSQCRPCGGSSFCAAHGRRKTICKECQSPAAKLNCFDLLMRDHKASILAEYVEQAPSTEKAPENQGRRVKIQCKT
jgi:hypothetical protein